MNKVVTFFKSFWQILVNTVNGFFSDKAMKLSGSLAYITIFSLPPMLLLIILFGGAFYGQAALEGRIYTSLHEITGENTAKQIQNIIIGLQQEKHSTFATVFGIIAMSIGATGIFVEIQDSLNLIWGVRPKPKKGFIKLLLNRLISFSMILGLGFLLIVALIVNAIIIGLSNYILNNLPDLPFNMINFINNGLVFLVISFLFSVIFKMLPDVKIKWTHIFPGAFLTAFLFLVGKYVIGIYIKNYNTISLYGAASSVVVLLVWIYFSAMILYFGAEFSRAYVEHRGFEIKPNSYAEYSDKRLVDDLSEKIKNIEKG